MPGYFDDREEPVAPDEFDRGEQDSNANYPQEPDFGAPAEDEGGGKLAGGRPPALKGTAALIQKVGRGGAAPPAPGQQPSTVNPTGLTVNQGGVEYEPYKNERGETEFRNPDPMARYQFLQEQMIQRLPPALQGQFRLQQLQLSQAERLEMQKAENGRAAIRANPNLTEAMKADALMMYDTKINPFALRQAQAQELGLQLKNQALQQNLETTRGLNSQAREADAKDLAKWTAVEPHAQKGQFFAQVDPHTGEIKVIRNHQQEHEDTLAQSQRHHDDKMEIERRKLDVDAEIKHAQKDVGLHEGHLAKVEKQVDREIEQFNPKVKGGPGIDVEFYKQHGRDRRQEVIDERMAAAGYGKNQADFLDQQATRRAKLRGGNTPPAGGPAEAGNLGPQPAAAPNTPKGVADAALARDRVVQPQVQQQQAQQAQRERLASLDNADKWITAYGDQEAAQATQGIRTIMRQFPDPTKIPPDKVAELAAAYARIAKYQQMK